MSRRHFGTDGIRGHRRAQTRSRRTMLRLGHTVGRVLRRGAQPVVLIQGHSDLGLHDRIGAGGFASAGVDTLMTGPLPTPGVACMTRAAPGAWAWSSVPRTTPTGQRHQVLLCTWGELPMNGNWRSRAYSSVRPIGPIPAQLGKARQAGRRARGVTSNSARARSATTTFHCEASSVVDAAHGAAYHIAPDVLHELGADVVSIGVPSRLA